MRRVEEHKLGINGALSHRYNLHKLVNYEVYLNIRSAINREKQIKSGPRSRKIKFIESHNPGWNDLIKKMGNIMDMVGLPRRFSFAYAPV